MSDRKAATLILAKAGWSTRRIAGVLELPQRTVARWLKSGSANGSRKSNKNKVVKAGNGSVNGSKVAHLAAVDNSQYIPSYYPQWLDVQAWQDFKAHRREMRQPLTERAEKMAIKQLDELRRQESQREIIERSIVNRWRGLFPGKNGRPAPGEGMGAKIQRMAEKGMIP